MRIYDDITAAIGRTPLIRLPSPTPGDIAMKLEYLNPAHSVKDRVALAIIDAAERSQTLAPGGTIVEATSGNTGIALAMVASVRGYKTVITMPESMSVERRSLMQAFGAEIILTPASQGMQGAVDEAQKIANERHGILASQFANEANRQMHYETTGAEIWADSEGTLTTFVAGVGTGGTISGAGRYLKERNQHIRIVAVEPAESPLLSSGMASPHGIQGIGANFVPEILDRDVIDQIITIPTEQAKEEARYLAKNYGIFAGISAGANMAAARSLAAQEEGLIVTIAPDTGHRYLSTDLWTVE